MLNWDKISCRKIRLNFGSLFQNLIYIGNPSTILQLLILNKAYYLELKIGSINESNQIPSTLQPFWNNYFELWTGRGETGIPLYQTWHIVNSITLYHITSHSILSYHMVSHPIKLSYQIGPPQIVAMYLQVLRGFGLSLDTRDSNAYVSCAKRTRCYAETASLPRANFVVWSMVIRLFTF